MNNPQPARWTNVVRMQLRLLRHTNRFEILKLSVAACGLGLLRPFLDWAGEPPRGRAFHWSLPVSRSHHDLARVAAGLLNMLGLIMILLFVSVIGLVLGGNASSLAALNTTAWASIFLCPVALYLTGSAVCILSNRPAAVLWTIYFSFMLPFVVSTLVEFEPGERFFGAILNGPVSYTVLLVKGFFPSLAHNISVSTYNWWVTAIFWLVVAAGSVLTAAVRHREN